jgi:HdeA/HdeB family
MKLTSTMILTSLLLSSSAMAQRVAVVRGVGTQTCKALVTSDKTDKQFEEQAAQWVLGALTSYFRQASDDPSRTMGDLILVQTVFDVCKKNADKTIDEAVTMAISALPTTEVKKPG